MSMPRRTWTGLATVAGTLAAGRGLRRLLNAKAIDLRDRVVLITGGSRGLGLELAREFARHGSRVVVCARNGDQAEEAAAELRAGGADAFAIACDVTDAEQVERTVKGALNRYGRLDVLVNNAGVITVAPFDAQTREDYHAALDTMFWGTYNATMAALPHLRELNGGRIINIGSIGGKLAAPHLLPYSVGKFAVTAFSEGLRAELAGEGVLVTTVTPGLMRTGSYRNALFKGDRPREYRWFALGASLPFTSTSAAHAARRIVAATRRGDAEVIVTWQAQLATRVQGLAPALTARLSGLINRVLPSAPDDRSATEPILGHETGAEPATVTVLGRKAADRNRET